jgi:hypothetical protein
MRTLTHCFALTALSAAFGLAAPIFITNHSFESANIGTQGAVSSIHPGWTGGLVFYPTATSVPVVPDGKQVMFLQGPGAATFQTLSDVLLANTDYTLTVDVLSRADFNPLISYQIRLEAGSTVLATTSAPVPAAGTVVTAQLQFAALAGNPNLGQPLTIRLISTGAGSSTSLFDNVRLDATPTAVPEPGAASLALVGLACLLAGRVRIRPNGRQTDAS